MIRFIYYFSKTVKGCFGFFIIQRFVTHNKYLTHQLLEDNDSVSAKSAVQK